MTIETEIASLKSNLLAELEKVQNESALSQLQIKYLGRKGIIRVLTGRIPTLSSEEKSTAGRLINEFKSFLAKQIEKKHQVLSVSTRPSQDDSFDLTLPGPDRPIGRAHPLYATLLEVNRIFVRLGFEIAYGQEIETEYYNFSALNIPIDHPSRDAFDTFYVADLPPDQSGRWLLRSHTSPVQIRVMEIRQPPFQVIVPGKVFRPDTPSASRFPMFHQVEGLMVGENITFAHLKGILDTFCKEFFGPKIQMRFRPSFFPFTEPSAEVDISCIICNGTGIRSDRSDDKCSVCRGEGWLEILGAGMVHPKVFEAVKYDTDKYTGFAFGMGVERMAMLKYRINDIRLFTENHIKFLTQF